MPRGVLILSIAALVAAGCKSRRPEADVAGGWTPSRGDVVMGVPSTSVVSSIQAAMATRPQGVPDDRWRHMQQLYTTYGNVPLWLEADGFNQSRSKALLRAVFDASTDALRLDEYPLDELVAAVSAVRATKQPTAEQLANADVLLTSAYVELAEDLLTGQVDPKSLAQDWHITGKHEPIDSAVARSLRDVQLDSAIARMRPRDPDYDALRRSLVSFRDIVGRGGWQTVPAGKALKPGQKDTPARLAALRERLRVEGFGGATPDNVAATAQNGPSAAQPAASIESRIPKPTSPVARSLSTSFDSPASRRASTPPATSTHACRAPMPRCHRF